MKNLLIQIKWQLVILARNNIISISLLVTLIYVVIFLGVRDLGNTDKLLMLFVMNDPAIIGLFFMSVALLIERRQQLLLAIFVSPINHHVYIWSRVMALSLVGLICALGMALAAVGLNFQWFHYSMGVLGVSVICCLLGLYLACFTSEFLKMLLSSIPVLLFILNPPLLNYFELTDFRLFDWMPAAGCIALLDSSLTKVQQPSGLIWAYVSMLIWIGLLYTLTYRTFMRKIVNA